MPVLWGEVCYLVSDREVNGDEGSVQRTFELRQTVINIDDVDSDVDRTGQRLMNGRVACRHCQMMYRLTLVVQRSVLTQTV